MTPHLFHPPFDSVDEKSMEAFRAFKRAMMLHRRLLMSTFSEQPLHPAQAGAVQALAHNDGMSQSDLADVLHVSRPTVTTMLKRMEAAGIVERRADDADARITRVYLSEGGRHIAERMHEGFSDLLNTSIGWLSDEDKDDLARILGKVNDHVEHVLKQRGVGHWVHPHAHHDHPNAAQHERDE
jgi:DNA-binding MarR family transcriptional regulator